MSSTPTWINASFVEAVLRGEQTKNGGGFGNGEDGSGSGGEGEGGSFDVRVTQMKVKTLPPGENFSSSIFRVHAHLQQVKQNLNTERYFIIKSIPATEAIAHNVRSAGFFQNETFMYTKATVEIERLLNATAPGRFPPMVPRCIHHGGYPNEFLALEDLTAKGFEVGDRRRGLDLRHSLLALRTLARFHAGSAALLARDPTAGRTLIPPMRTPEEDPFSRVVEGGCLALAEACEDWPHVLKKFPDLLRRMSKNAYAKMEKVTRRVEGAFNVILHGDFWTNNIMFRSENSVPVEVRFVDLQLARETSPAVEVIYFLYSSLSDDVAENCMELLVREYHVVLTETLDLLDLKGPSFEEFKKDIDRVGFFALMCLVVITPFVRSLKGYEPDMEQALQGKWNVNKHLYKTAHCKKWLSKWLIEFCEKGWLSEEDFK